MTAFVLFSLLRLALVPAFDLMPQSAYYFTAYAEHPALSYFDHPPMIGWLLWLPATLVGESAVAVHLTVFAVTLATQLAFHRLAGAFLDREGGSRALALLTSSGVVILVSLVAVPDVPLLLFWTLALLALRRALFEAPAAGTYWLAAGASWLAAGAAMGLAFLSKYTGVFLQGGMVLFLLLSPQHRRLLRTPWPWATLAVAQLVSLPVYAWNLRHGLASFSYQTAGRAAGGRLDLDGALGFLATQLVVLLPVAFGVFLARSARGTVRAIRPGRLGRMAPETLFLLAFSVPVFATCLALSTVAWVKVNWALPAYVAGTILVAGAVGRRALRWHLATGALLHLVLAVQLVAYPVPVTSDDTWFGWSELARRVEERMDRHPGAFVFAVDHYKTTAELRFYGDLPAYGMNVLGWEGLHYDYVDGDLGRLAGRDALMLRSEADLEPSSETERYAARARLFFEDVREVEPIRIEHRGRLMRFFRVFHCSGYRGPDAGP